MPRSTAARIREIISCLSLAGPRPKLIPMQPSPIAETSRPLFPSLRFFILKDRSSDRRLAREKATKQTKVFAFFVSFCLNSQLPNFSPLLAPGSELIPKARRARRSRHAFRLPTSIRYRAQSLSRFFGTQPVYRLFQQSPRQRRGKQGNDPEHDQTQRRYRDQESHLRRQPTIENHRHQDVVNVKSVADSSGKHETGIAQEARNVSIEACHRSRNQNHKRTGLERFYQNRFQCRRVAVSQHRRNG